jgi:CHAT domain-containing protein
MVNIILRQSLSALQWQLIDTEDDQKRQNILEEIYQIEIQQLGTQAIGSFARAEPVTIEQLQNGLRPTELLLGYVLQSPHSYALAITHDSIASYPLSEKEVIERQAEAYRRSVRENKDVSALATQLFEELLSAIPEYHQKTSVIIIPDGKLHLLPFSSLLDQQGQYTILTHTLSTAPSGTVLSLLRKRTETKAGRKSYLGVAAWTQTDTHPGIFRQIINGPSRAQLKALPESQSEVETIGAMLPKPSTILLGSAATKDRFKQLPLADYRVLHLALHGYADPEFPDRSALVFAPLVGPSTADAGFLQIREILQLHLDASLVTLSACDTGVGPTGQDGIANVVEAFIQAGAHTVVSTLWELEDRSTKHLMRVFYDHLTRGEEKAEALRQAQLDRFYWDVPGWSMLWSSDRQNRAGILPYVSLL